VVLFFGNLAQTIGGLRLHQVLHRFTFLVTHVTQALVVLEPTIAHQVLPAVPLTTALQIHVARVQTTVRQVPLAVLLITQEQ
jgi:hypothetical protein